MNLPTAEFIVLLPVLFLLPFTSAASDLSLNSTTGTGSEFSFKQTTARNPHSKALGQRIAGGVLLGLGGVNLVTGIIFDAKDVIAERYADMGMRETGDIIEKISWIEGSVMLAIGIPLAVIGNVKFSRWKKWEAEHGRSVSLHANGVTIEF